MTRSVDALVAKARADLLACPTGRAILARHHGDARADQADPDPSRAPRTLLAVVPGEALTADDHQRITRHLPHPLGHTIRRHSASGNGHELGDLL